MDEVWDIAAKARSKLQMEADRPEYCLRRMVLTANMLDDLMEQIFALGQKLDTDDSSGQGLRWSNRVAGDLMRSGYQEDSDEDCDDDCSSDSGSDGSIDTDDIVTPPPLTDSRVIALVKGELRLAEHNPLDNDACSDDTCSDDGCSDDIDIVELLLTRCQTQRPSIEDKIATEVDVVQLVTRLDPLEDSTERRNYHHGAIVESELLHPRSLEKMAATEVNVVQLFTPKDSLVDSTERDTCHDDAIANAKLPVLISAT